MIKKKKLQNELVSFQDLPCSLATTTVLLQKHSFYLSLIQNSDGNVKHKHVTHSSKKSTCLCVCTGLASLEAALMAPLYLSVYVTKQNKAGNNMPSAHSYCLTTGSLAGGWFFLSDSAWRQPVTPASSTRQLQHHPASQNLQHHPASLAALDTATCHTSGPHHALMLLRCSLALCCDALSQHETCSATQEPWYCRTSSPSHCCCL